MGAVLTFLLALTCLGLLLYCTVQLVRGYLDEWWFLGLVLAYLACVGSWMWWVYTAGIGV